MKSQKSIREPLIETSYTGNALNLKVSATFNSLDKALITVTDETDNYW